jgi:hypothetical protein
VIGGAMGVESGLVLIHLVQNDVVRIGRELRDVELAHARVLDGLRGIFLGEFKELR